MSCHCIAQQQVQLAVWSCTGMVMASCAHGIPGLLYKGALLVIMWQ